MRQIIKKPLSIKAFSPLEMSDDIKSIIKKLNNVVIIQIKIGKMFKIGDTMTDIKIDKYDINGLNKIIETINNNFNILNKKIIEENSKINSLVFGETFEMELFFIDFNKKIILVSNDNTIEIQGDKNNIVFNVEAETINYGNK